MVSSYAMFVKEHIHKFKHLPAKQRMKAVAELYHKQKSGMSEPAKKERGRPKKGGGFFDDLLNNPENIAADVAVKMLGLGGSLEEGKLVRKKKGGVMTAAGLDEKGGVMTAAGLHKKRGRPKKGGAMTAGSLLGDIIPFGNMLGLGLNEKKRGRKAKGGAMTAGALDEKGGSIFGDIIPFGNMLGLGLNEKKRGRKAKGGAMTAGALPMAHSVGPLHAGSFADMFFKGLTAPFAVASKIPIPGLQQIGEAGTQAFNALGAPTLF